MIGPRGKVAPMLSQPEKRLTILDEKSPRHLDTGLALDENADEKSDEKTSGVAEQVKPRIPLVLENPQKRVTDFREVEQGFASEKEAHYEALRCLRCDLEKEREQ